VAREAQQFDLHGGFNDWSHETMDCHTAIEECDRMFAEARNSAYLDRGSSITKVLLDHEHSVDDVRRIGILHNDLAREERGGRQTAATLERFAASVTNASYGSAASVAALSSPYRRISTAAANAGARF
jgi:hypothetical protein